MSTLYKDEKDVEISVEVRQSGGNINLLFTADCGKFGTDEIIDEIDITPKELLESIRGLEN